MEITLLKEWINGQGKELSAGAKVDICRDTYKKLVSDRICDPLPGEKKAKKKTKKIKIDGDTNSSDNSLGWLNSY